VTAAAGRRVAIVLKGYPRLSETFIAQEIRGLEEAGMDLVLISLRAPTDKKRHAVHDEIVAPVLYLPEYLYQEPLRVLRGFAAALRRPSFWSVLGGFLRDLWRDPTPNRGRRLGQAAVLVAEWPDGAGWLHAHFIHTPASVADYSARIMGVGYSVSAHAKDIWTSPDWELSGKLNRAAWTVTCTASGHRHLQALAADPARVHLSYHGLNLDRFPAFDTPRAARDGALAGDAKFGWEAVETTFSLADNARFADEGEVFGNVGGWHAEGAGDVDDHEGFGAFLEFGEDAPTDNVADGL